MNRNRLISDKIIFVVSIACILTLVFLWGSCSQMKHNPLADYIPSLKDWLENKPDEFPEPESENPEERNVTFSFVGPASNEGKSREDAVEQEIEAGDNPEREGAVPEFTIELGGNRIEDIARHYGFLLVAVSGNEILGKVEPDKLTPLSEKELEKYSLRARDASNIEDYRSMVQTISRATGISANNIRLLYLVPNSVESYFIDVQRQAIKEYGLDSQTVRLMVGRYLRDYRVAVQEVIMEDGRRLTL